MRFRNLAFVQPLLFISSMSLAQVFSVGLWPNEGKPTLSSLGKPIPVFKMPSSKSAKIGDLALKKAQTINFSDAVTITLKPGLILFNKGSELKGTDYGSVTTLSRDEYYDRGTPFNEKTTKDETFEYLQYRAEGSFFIRRKGKIFALESGPKPLSQPTIEWWVRLKLPKNKLDAGWIKFESAMMQDQRQFQGE
jgi:hypothetical protein